ncbi:MAG TPA: sterol carrier protein domain-containing protein [Mycobacteriales bacterium]|nr:sterol carrier protein domain-containing protein [Mycobacteriales bacterium]
MRSRGDGDGPRGYAVYATVSAWDEGVANGTVRVRELCARDPAAEAALWRYLLDLDLMRRLTVTLPPDAALVHLLVDPRQARPRMHDNLWARLVDVPTALSRRRYASELDVVLDVTDAVRPANTRRWRLTANAGGATCGPTRDAPDLALPVAALGAAYLGGTRLSALAGAGRVRELRPGALDAASRAFAGDREPYCPEEF